MRPVYSVMCVASGTTAVAFPSPLASTGFSKAPRAGGAAPPVSDWHCLLPTAHLTPLQRRSALSALSTMNQNCPPPFKTRLPDVYLPQCALIGVYHRPSKSALSSLSLLFSNCRSLMHQMDELQVLVVGLRK